MQAELKALILDVDGTLADTEDRHRQAFNAAFAQAGLDWHWDAALYGELLAVTGGKERMRHFIARERPDFEMPADADVFIASLHASKTRHYVDALSSGQIPLRPGVERLLREARNAGIRLAIATTTTPDNVIALLEHSFSEPATDWFEVIADAGVVPKKKPAPDVYEYALDKLALPAEACLAIEDSLNGLHAATAAGLESVVTVNTYTEQQDFTGALAVLDHLGDPGLPCTLLHGSYAPDGMVDINYLMQLHEQTATA